MQRVAVYLEHATTFERLADAESIAEIKATFAKQAARYRDLAERRERFLRAAFPNDDEVRSPDCRGLGIIQNSRRADDVR